MANELILSEKRRPGVSGKFGVGDTARRFDDYDTWQEKWYPGGGRLPSERSSREYEIDREAARQRAAMLALEQGKADIASRSQEAIDTRANAAAASTLSSNQQFANQQRLAGETEAERIRQAASNAASVDWWSKRDANGRLLQPPGSESFTPQTSLRSAYSSFLGTPATTATAAPQAAASPDLSQVNSLIQQLTQQATEGRATREANASAMRNLLQGRIQEASAPVDVNALGLRPILAAQRLARQRSAERQRSQVAARLSREGLLDSGAFDTAISGIEEARGAGESADIAATLAPEQQARRQELLSLYQMALSQGDNESAQALQQQIAALGAAQGAASLGEQGRQFNATFGESQRRFAADEDFRRSSFLDNLRLAMAR